MSQSLPSPNQTLPSFHVDLSPRDGRDLFLSGICMSVRGRYTAIVALTSLARTRGYETLGYGNPFTFASETAGLSRREVHGMLRVGHALMRLRKVDEAFRSGTLCWSKARSLAQVATEESEDAGSPGRRA
jgi:hypothetical protein